MTRCCRGCCSTPASSTSSACRRWRSRTRWPGAEPGADQRQSEPARRAQRLVRHPHAVGPLHLRILRLRRTARRVLLPATSLRRSPTCARGARTSWISPTITTTTSKPNTVSTPRPWRASRQPDPLRPRRRGRVLPGLYPRLRRAVLLRDRRAPGLSGFRRRQRRDQARGADPRIAAADHAQGADLSQQENQKGSETMSITRGTNISAALLLAACCHLTPALADPLPAMTASRPPFGPTPIRRSIAVRLVKKGEELKAPDASQPITAAADLAS